MLSVSGTNDEKLNFPVTASGGFPLAQNRRRRPPRGRCDHPHPPAVLPATPDLWPSGPEIARVCDVEALTTAMLTQVTSDDLLKALKAMPSGHQQLVLGVLGLRKAATVNRGMAAQLLARLRGCDPTSRAELLRDVVTPVFAALDAGATPAQWRAMLGQDDRAALAAYAAQPTVANSLGVAVRSFSPALLAAGLAAAINADTAASAVGLAVLAADHDSARLAHTSLRVTYLQMPPIPTAPLATLVPAVRLAAHSGVKGDLSAEELADLLDDYIDDVSDEVVNDEIVELAAALLHSWQAVLDAAQAILQDLVEGRLPPPSTAAQIAAHASSGADVVVALGAALGAEVPQTRDGLDAAVNALRRRKAAATDTAWLRQLTALQGPETVEVELADVRKTAAAALDDPDVPRDQLVALWQLLQLAAPARRGESVDYAELGAAQAAANAAWPDSGSLVTAAAFGALIVPDEGVRPSANTACGDPHNSDPSTDDLANHVENVDSAGAGDAESVDRDLADSKPADCGPVATGPADPRQAEVGDPTVVAPTGPAGVKNLEETDAATYRTPVAAADGAHDDDRDNLSNAEDLADLDALLAAGAGAAFIAVGAPDRRVPDPTPEAPVPPSQSDDVSGIPQRLDDADTACVAGVAASLLSAERFGLAADLLEAAGAPAASVAARRLTTYAAQLSSPTGCLASAFAELEPQVRRDALGDDRGGQLLALSAAARVALLAPSAGPASVLFDLLPCVREQQALTEVLNALAEASRTGIVVLAEAADVMGTLAAAEADAAQAAAAAADLLSGAAHRVIKYIPANGVYQAWMSPSGALGAMLTQVAANDPSAVVAVRDAVVKLRGGAQRAIDTTFAKQRRNHFNRIIAGSRGTLLSRWNDAVDLAARWTDLVEVTERHAAMAAGAWQAGPLTKLRHRVNKVRELALAELTGVHGHEDPVTAAAVDAARKLLLETFAICNGNVPDGPEPSVPFAAHAELLATDLPLEPGTLLPDGGLSAEHLPTLLILAADDPVDTTSVYTLRAARGDHDLTAVLIANSRAGDPATAALDRRRSTDITTQAGEVVAEVAALSSLIDTRRLAGALDDQPWAALAARAEALADPTRRDFGRIRAAVAEVTADLNAHQERKIRETLARIDERARDNTGVAENAEFFADLARSGKIASAEEYLETALTGGRLPAPSDRVDHLARFFPTLPELAIARPTLLSDLHAALGKRTDLVEVPGLVAAGLDLAALSDARREAGRKALGTWAALTGRSPQVELSGALRAVLAQAGLEFAAAELEQPPARHPSRQWVRLSGVSGTGPALTPALGSAMSPDGATLRVLLVRQAPTPATLIEWMGSETPDRTVVALWLSGALSPADRRAIADAARGRPHPPLMLLDSAALAYLVCQTEPRRATFEATALPFTAASPYRDTPGDTPREMFYGRTDELAAVVDLNGPSFVSGGRQLGKSALLRVAKRRFEETEGRYAVLTSVFTVGGDGRPERLWGVLWPHLARIGIVGDTPPAGEHVDLAEVVYTAVLRWLEADPRRALLILLDEADAFLNADAAGALFKHVDTCRRLMWDSERRAKVVFAGLHRTARFESLPNQPLSHLGRPISVGPLRPQHAYDLITRPLSALGFTFPDDRALPARILAMANSMPALLQLFGQALVAHLSAQQVPDNGPPYSITDADVDDVFADAELRAAFREKYVLTLNLDHRYLVIAFSVAAAAHDHGVDHSLNLVELSDMARSYWPEGFSSVGADDFRGLVTECVDLGVLAADGGRYRLRTPTVLRLLGTEDEVLETLYSASERMRVRSASDAGSFRRRVGPDNPNNRSALTESQLGRLFDTRRQVLTVTGSVALGGDTVLSAIEAAWSEEAHRVGSVARVRTATPDGVRGAVARVGAMSGLLLVDAQTLSTAKLRELLSAAQAAVDAASRDVTVAVVTSPGNAAVWADLAARIDLRRVDEPGLRMWCDEEGLPFRDEEARATLMAATGGWPQVVAHAARLATAAGPAAGNIKVLADLEKWLAAAGGRQLVTGAGLGPHTPALAEAFRSAVHLCNPEGEDRHVLAELLEIDDRVNLCELAEDAGFRSLGGVIAALTALSCLTVTAAGLLRPEPLLAAQMLRRDGAVKGSAV